MVKVVDMKDNEEGTVIEVSDPVVLENLAENGSEEAQEELENITAPDPVLLMISPDTAVMGDPEFIMTLTGENFTEASVVIFNNGDAPTTFISPNELSIAVDPSTASGPWTVPVLVRTGEHDTIFIDFTFTEAEAGGGGETEDGGAGTEAGGGESLTGLEGRDRVQGEPYPNQGPADFEKE